jgi:Spy/CpxP family protein refolding chaperone
MKSFRVIIPVLALTLAACGDMSSTDSTTSPVSAGDSSKPAMRPHGPEMLLFASLKEDIKLTDAQRKTIEGLIESSKPTGEPPAPPSVDKLAAAIRAGSIDVAAFEAERPAPPDMTPLISALTTLHTTLTSEQRTALVSAIQKRMAEMGPPPPPPFLAELGLSDAQKESIRAALEKTKPAEDPAARLSTFATATFDAKTFVTPPAGDRMLRELAAIVPILTAEQRETLATRLEAGPPPAK